MTAGVEEAEQVQALVNGAQGVANDLSLTGQHIAAAQLQGLIQLTRVLWTRLQPKPETEAKEPPRLEAV